VNVSGVPPTCVLQYTLFGSYVTPVPPPSIVTAPFVPVVSTD
jgi:hypothetical protein